MGRRTGQLAQRGDSHMPRRAAVRSTAGAGPAGPALPLASLPPLDNDLPAACAACLQPRAGVHGGPAAAAAQDGGVQPGARRAACDAGRVHRCAPCMPGRLRVGAVQAAGGGAARTTVRVRGESVAAVAVARCALTYLPSGAPRSPAHCPPAPCSGAQPPLQYSHQRVLEECGGGGAATRGGPAGQPAALQAPPL